MNFVPVTVPCNTLSYLQMLGHTDNTTGGSRLKQKLGDQVFQQMLSWFFQSLQQKLQSRFKPTTPTLTSQQYTIILPFLIW